MLASGPRLATAATSSPTSSPPLEGAAYSEEALMTLKRAADHVFDDWYPRCDPKGAGVRDRASADRGGAVHELLMAGASYALFVEQYWMPPGAQTDLILERVVPAFERAFDCDPGPEARHLLARALTEIDRQLARFGGSGEHGRDTARLQNKRAMLEEKLELAVPPPPLPCPLCLDPVGEPCPDAPQGYDTWRGRLSLRLELGPGWVADRSHGGTVPTFAAHLGAGIRLFADRSPRHALLLGLDYGATGHRGAQTRLHSIVGRVEHSLRAHPRWFALQTAIEGGMTIFLERPPTSSATDSAGRGVLGVALGLCTWGEAACIRGRIRGFNSGGGSGDPGGSENKLAIAGAALLLGVDLFRLAENLRPVDKRDVSSDK